MKSRIIHFRDTITQSRAYFAIFKLPVIVFTALFGFILEFVIELPFMVLCMLDRHLQRPEQQSPGTTVSSKERLRDRKTEGL